MQKFSRSPALASGLAAVIMWGLAPVATRAVVLHLGPLPLLVLRALLSGVIVLPWALPALRRIDRAGFTRLAIAGLLGMVGYFLPVAVGIQWLPASTAALILATEPVWIMCLSRLCHGEPVARSAWLGSGIALCGVAVLAGPRLAAGSHALLGMGLVMLGTMLFAAYTIALRPVTEQYGARAATAASTAVGAVPYLALLPWIFSHHQSAWFAHQPTSTWADLVFLAAGSTAAGMLAWNLAVARLGSSQAGLLLFLEPCVGVTGGIVLLGEHLSPVGAVGGALVMTGLVVAWRAARVSLRHGTDRHARLRNVQRRVFSRLGGHPRVDIGHCEC
jgi:drug/metabolite transporter (DMT)-like permease